MVAWGAMSAAQASQGDSASGDPQALQEALQQTRILNRLSLELASAATMEEVMLAMARPWMATEEFSAALGTVESGASGVPEWMNMVARWPPHPSNPTGPVRYYLPEYPASGLWRFDPQALVEVADIDNDERLDEGVRQVYQRMGYRSTIAMSISNRGRCIGFLGLAWRQLYRPREHDRRLCAAIGRLAGLLFENRLLFERMEAALQENKHQRLALAAILEHLPVGVLVVDLPPTRLLLKNPAAARISGVELAAEMATGQGAGDPQLAGTGSSTPRTLVDLPISRMSATGQAQTDELEVLHKGGTLVAVERIVAPIFDENAVMSQAIIVLSDVSARKRAEQEQRHLRDALIRAQAAALAERSTPLIPITDEILVMPLVGSLDTERSQQLLDVLLAGVSKGRVRAAIIDITGVRMVDTQAAGTLTQAAQALRLLGVHPVLTGIRADVAQTLVSLGLPMAGIISLSTLQDGLAYARKLMGYRIDAPLGAGRSRAR